MSFRLFIYYCALCGAWAALIGWFLGRLVPITEDEHPLLLQGLKAFLLGLTVALALGLVDAISNVPLARVVTIALRGATAVVIGSMGALASGVIGEYVQQQTQAVPFVGEIASVVSWAITGLLIGASLGAFEIAVSLATRTNLRGAIRKGVNGAIGGMVGGFLGGSLRLVLWYFLARSIAVSQGEPLSPSALGFVVLGLCIGLLIGLAQVILKEAWLKVEAGFRAGRELMLTKDETTIGRAEACDLGLYGDNAIDKVHARIKRVNGRYILADGETKTGTFVNDQRVVQPVTLRAGDKIRLGKSVLSFGERKKRDD
jgi:Inner membrane component of T3SS, cytoplasmic domain